MSFAEISCCGIFWQECSVPIWPKIHKNSKIKSPPKFLHALYTCQNLPLLSLTKGNVECFLFITEIVFDTICPGSLAFHCKSLLCREAYNFIAQSHHKFNKAASSYYIEQCLVKALKSDLKHITFFGIFSLSVVLCSCDLRSQTRSPWERYLLNIVVQMQWKMQLYTMTLFWTKFCSDWSGSLHLYRQLVFNTPRLGHAFLNIRHPSIQWHSYVIPSTFLVCAKDAVWGECQLWGLKSSISPSLLP